MSKEKIKVVIVGVGNCASALYQGLHYYKDHPQDKNIPGVMYNNIGGYFPQDIEVVGAFDVDSRKVGTPLGEAIFAKPNCCRVFVNQNELVGKGPVVLKAPVLDGVGVHTGENLDENYQFKVDEDQIPVSLDEELARLKPDILINYLPVGSQEATENLAEVCLRQKVAFLNCIPVFIASDVKWAKRFEKAGVAIVGDDMKSQFGASILSQMIQELAFNRGLDVSCHIQCNKGGNMDFYNMTDKNRLKSKKISKENVIKCQNTIRGIPVVPGSIHAGPSDFIPYLKDNKVADFIIDMVGFGGAPVKLNAVLSVQDSENSAGVVLDAIRYLKVAKELGLCGPLKGPSAWTQKSPPLQLTAEEAILECEALANRQIPKSMDLKPSEFMKDLSQI